MNTLVKLIVKNNLVILSKDQPYQGFLNAFLTKYENVTKIDIYNSRKNKRVFKVDKERRDLYLQDYNNIYFSRGLLEIIPRWSYEIDDQSNYTLKVPQLSDEEIRKTLDVFDLRDDQIIAVKKCLLLKRGVVQLPTATGKSAIITSVIKRLLEVNPEMKFLVLAPTLSTVKNINDTIKENGIDTEIFAHPSKTIKKSVTTSLVQSLLSQNDSKLLEGIDAVLYDECLPGTSKVLCSDFTYRSIKEIYEDDSINEVVSYDLSSGKYRVNSITRKIRSEYNSRFWRLYYYDPTDKNRLKGISLTNNHKVYCVNRKEYVPAEEIKQGDRIKIDIEFLRFNEIQSATEAEVCRITKNVGSFSKYKYNLEVENDHNYFADNVLVSNCHHLKCSTWNSLNLMLVNAQYSLGFSALSIGKNEIYKNDIREISYDSTLIIGSSGRVIMHMDPSYYIERGIIALPVIMRVSHNESLPASIDESEWSKVVKFGLLSTARTAKISTIANIFSKYKRKVLILVSEKDQAFSVGRFLFKEGQVRFGISFGAGEGFICEDLNESDEVSYKKEESLKVLEKLSTGEIDILIATSHLDEGVDIKKLDVCILACGGKKDRRIIQRVGRVLRKSKTGKYAYIVDFTDSGSRVLSKHSRSRLNMYKKDIGVPSELIIDNIHLDEIENKFKEMENIN